MYGDQPDDDAAAQIGSIANPNSWFSMLYLMLFTTIVLFALFVNWFFKLRCRDRLVGRSRGRKF